MEKWRYFLHCIWWFSVYGRMRLPGASTIVLNPMIQWFNYSIIQLFNPEKHLKNVLKNGCLVARFCTLLTFFAFFKGLVACYHPFLFFTVIDQTYNVIYILPTRLVPSCCTHGFPYSGGVPNSDLPYSKPTRYCLSHAASVLFCLFTNKKLIWLFTPGCGWGQHQSVVCSEYSELRSPDRSLGKLWTRSCCQQLGPGTTVYRKSPKFDH